MQEQKQETFTLDSLRERLAGAGIDVSKFGVGKARTLENLLEEIEDGETILTTDENGDLLRKVVVGSVEIYYTSPEGKRFVLREGDQVFRDGRRRRRKSLERSISEKGQKNEDGLETMIRGIRQETKIKGDINIKATGEDEVVAYSTGYPGLKTHYTFHRFEAVLSDDQYNPDGYIEKQEEKTNYTFWKDLEEAGEIQEQ